MKFNEDIIRFMQPYITEAFGNFSIVLIQVDSALENHSEAVLLDMDNIIPAGGMITFAGFGLIYVVYYQATYYLFKRNICIEK